MQILANDPSRISCSFRLVIVILLVPQKVHNDRPDPQLA